jgi:hypothetical protein
VEKELLSKTHLQVYDTVVNCGPVTAGEVFLDMLEQNPETAMPRNLAAARLAELRAMGVVEATGVRKCDQSGRNCVTWEATGRLPKAPKPRRDFWIVENGKSKRLYTDETAAKTYQKKSGGSVLCVTERRHTVRQVAAKKQRKAK